MKYLSVIHSGGTIIDRDTKEGIACAISPGYAQQMAASGDLIAALSVILRHEQVHAIYAEKAITALELAGADTTGLTRGYQFAT